MVLPAARVMRDARRKLSGTSRSAFVEPAVKEGSIVCPEQKLEILRMSLNEVGSFQMPRVAQQFIADLLTAFLGIRNRRKQKCAGHDFYRCAPASMIDTPLSVRMLPVARPSAACALT